MNLARRSTDVADKQQWAIEESEILRRANGDAELAEILRKAQTSQPADMIGFKQDAIRQAGILRVTLGGGRLSQRDRITALELLDQVVRIVEDA